MVIDIAASVKRKKSSMTPLHALQIFMKFLLQTIFDIRRIFWSLKTQPLLWQKEASDKSPKSEKGVFILDLACSTSNLSFNVFLKNLPDGNFWFYHLNGALLLWSKDV